MTAEPRHKLNNEAEWLVLSSVHGSLPGMICEIASSFDNPDAVLLEKHQRHVYTRYDV